MWFCFCVYVCAVYVCVYMYLQMNVEAKGRHKNSFDRFLFVCLRQGLSVNLELINLIRLAGQRACLSLGFTAVNRHHDQGNSYKGQHLIGAGLQIQRFSLLSSKQEHGNIQAGMVQEELRVLHLLLKAANGRLTSRQLG